MINTFPTDVLYNLKCFVPLAHVLLKSPIGPLISIIYECISMLSMLAGLRSRVYVCRICSVTINYLNI